MCLCVRGRIWKTLMSDNAVTIPHMLPLGIARKKRRTERSFDTSALSIKMRGSHHPATPASEENQVSFFEFDEIVQKHFPTWRSVRTERGNSHLGMGLKSLICWAVFRPRADGFWTLGTRLC
jgi:hypothetical protein